MSLLFPFNDPVALQADPPTVMVSGHGCYVVDRQGREYLDAVAGLWCASLGFSDEALITAAERQLRQLPFYHSFLGRTAEPTLQLAERLIDIAPAPLARAFFANSGSEAVDSAVKFVWYYNNARGKSDKKRIIARQGAYHGSGLMSGGLTAMDYCHTGFDLPGPMVLRTGLPHYKTGAKSGESEIGFSRRRAQELDELIRREGPDTIGAFIGEPIIGSGGAIPPPEGYWAEIQAVLARHDVLLIADEIITGFGRTGYWFGCQRYGIEPDMMTLAKQLSGAYMPISAVLVSDSVANTISAHAHELGTFGHGFTYGGHPVAAAVAIAAIEQYKTQNICQRVLELEEHFARRLEPLGNLPGVVEIRLAGLIAGVELYPGQHYGGARARAVADAAERRGVLFRVIDNTIAISPPLIVSQTELDRITNTLHESIVEVGVHR